MKSKPTTIAFFAAGHFLLFWVSVGILKVTGFTMFNWFGPPHRNSPFQEVLFVCAGILSYPMAWLADFIPLPANGYTITCGSVLNSIIWGACIGWMIYGFSYRRRCQAV